MERSGQRLVTQEPSPPTAICLRPSALYHAAMAPLAKPAHSAQLLSPISRKNHSGPQCHLHHSVSSSLAPGSELWPRPPLPGTWPPQPQAPSWHRAPSALSDHPQGAQLQPRWCPGPSPMQPLPQKHGPWVPGVKQSCVIYQWLSGPSRGGTGVAGPRDGANL